MLMSVGTCSRPTTPWDGSCLWWQLSWVAVVLGGSCPTWQLSYVAIVLGGSCPGWQLSYVAVVLRGSCPDAVIQVVVSSHNTIFNRNAPIWLSDNEYSAYSTIILALLKITKWHGHVAHMAKHMNMVGGPAPYIWCCLLLRTQSYTLTRSFEML